MQPALNAPWGEHGVSPGDNGAEAKVSLRDVLLILRRRWILALSVVLAGAALGMAYLLAVTPVYEAHANLLIDPEMARVAAYNELSGLSVVRPDYYETQLQVLSSRTLARMTIERLKLWTSAELRKVRATPAAPPTAGAGATGGPLREDNEQARAIDGFLARLRISPRTNTRIVDVGWRSADRRLAARVVNTLCDAYIAQNLEFRRAASKEASAFLQQQLDEQRTRVQASERALQGYREKTGIVQSVGRENPGVQRLGELSAAATHARTVRIHKQALYRQLTAIYEKRASIDSVPEVLSNPFIQQLKSELAGMQRRHAEASERLGSEHPEILTLKAGIRTAEAKLAGELRNMLDSSENDLLSGEAEERGLEAALEAQKRNALTEDRKTIELDVLERNLASDRRLFDSLLQRAKESDISRELKATNIRVLDTAELPQGPLWPRISIVLTLGLFFGVGAAGIVVFAAETLDDRVRSPRDLRTRLRLDALGLVPRLTPADISATSRLLADSTASVLGETFRFVRANALSLADASGSRQFVITSASAGDGKTIVAANLAAALSQAGDRVLLVDGDMRAPSIHTVFAVPCTPGLSDVLTTAVRLDEAICATASPDLWLLPAGSPTKRPADLLGSERFRQLAATLARRFDWLVIDSPPSSAVVDACLIGRAGCSVLFVVGANQTSRRAADDALRQLNAAGVRVAGAVLNRVDFTPEQYPYGHDTRTA